MPWRPRGRGPADGHTNACPPAVGKALTGRERGAGARARAHLFPRINSTHRHHLPVRCGAENLFFRCSYLSSIRESHVLFHTDSPTCVIPCPRALYDALASPEASWRTAEAAALAATAHAAFRPLDPMLIAQCFPPIGRRPVACSAIDLRLALREGRPISRARSFFFRAIRVDSPTSPAVACSVRRQLSLHVERLLGRAHIAHLFCPSQYSPTVGLRVLVSSPRFLIFTTQSPAYSPSSPAVACSVRKQPSLLSSSWRLDGVLPSFRHFERDVCAESHPLTFCGPLRSTRRQVPHTVHRVQPCVSSALHNTSTFSSVPSYPSYSRGSTIC